MTEIFDPKERSTKNQNPETNQVGQEAKETPPVHVDVYVNPFLTEDQRSAIIAGKEQDPEWD